MGWIHGKRASLICVYFMDDEIGLFVILNCNTKTCWWLIKEAVLSTYRNH